jgi:DNA-binding response OmpR family regulator
MKLLLVEDSPRLRRSLEIGLRQAGFAVDVAADGIEGLRRAQSFDYDLIVLDWMLPGLDGLALLRRLRAARRRVRVLFLTAKDAVSDRVTGLENGADDYLVKPFALDELLARVRALCRRTYDASTSAIELGDLSIDVRARTAKYQGELLDLTRREFMLLEYLVLRRGELVSRAEIEGRLYDDAREPASNVVEATVHRLRKKLEAGGRPALISTRRGLGYRLEVPA